VRSTFLGDDNKGKGKSKNTTADPFRDDNKKARAKAGSWAFGEE
jgi:hypothetical protein